MPFEPPERFNMAHWFLDARVEEGLGSRPAILTADRTLTYLDVQREANRVANALGAAGLSIEQRTLIVMPDAPEFAAAFFGTLKAGGVVAMANPLLPVEDYDYLLEYTRARVVLAHASAMDRLEPALTRARWATAAFVAGGSGDARVAGRVRVSPWSESVSKASD